MRFTDSHEANSTYVRVDIKGIFFLQPGKAGLSEIQPSVSCASDGKAEFSS